MRHFVQLHYPMKYLVNSKMKHVSDPHVQVSVTPLEFFLVRIISDKERFITGDEISGQKCPPIHLYPCFFIYLFIYYEYYKDIYISDKSAINMCL